MSFCRRGAPATRPRGIAHHCSKICCMYVAKHTMLYRHKVHGGKAFVFFMDVRAGGKGYEEFVRRAIEEDGGLYQRPRPPDSTGRGRGGHKVHGSSTRSAARPVVLDADMVVLAHGHAIPQPARHRGPRPEALRLLRQAKGFINEAHPKLRPVETNTAGVYVAGACQAPKDIPSAWPRRPPRPPRCWGSSPAGLEREPVVDRVNRTACVHCRVHDASPYKAIEDFNILDRSGKVVACRQRQRRALPGCGSACRCAGPRAWISTASRTSRFTCRLRRWNRRSLR